LNVLIAEDEQDISFMYKLALESRKHTVSIVSNGDDCLKLYNCSGEYHHSGKKSSDRRKITPPFDVIVLDYKMPKKNGIEVAKQILKWNPNQRIIFASAFVNDTLLDSVRYLNRPVELIQKPFKIETLVDMIEDIEVFDSVKSISNMTRKIKNIENPSDREIKKLLRILIKAQKNKGFKSN
jgi:DNA-binding response OmpR family regulator